MARPARVNLVFLKGGGTVLFDDTFNGVPGSLSTHNPDVGSSWELVNDVTFDLDGLGNAVLSDLGLSTVAFALAHGSASFPSSFNVEFEGNSDGNDSNGIVFNYQDENNYWRVNWLGSFAIQQVSGGTPTTKLAALGSDTSGRIEVTPTSVKLYTSVDFVGTVARTAPAGTGIGLFSAVVDASIFSRIRVTG